MTALAAAPESPEITKSKGECKAKAEAVTEKTPIRRAARFVWGMLLARIYDQRKSLWDEVFPLICPKCGGTMKIFAFMARGHPVDEGEAIRAILNDRGEPVDPPRIAPARGSPLWEATARQSDDALLAQPIPEFEFDQRIAW